MHLRTQGDFLAGGEQALPCLPFEMYGIGPHAGMDKRVRHRNKVGSLNLATVAQHSNEFIATKPYCCSNGHAICFSDTRLFRSNVLGRQWQAGRAIAAV